MDKKIWQMVYYTFLIVVAVLTFYFFLGQALAAVDLIEQRIDPPPPGWIKD